MPNPLTLFPATNGYRRRLYDGRAVSVYYDCRPRNEWGEHTREQEQVSAFLNGAVGRLKWKPPDGENALGATVPNDDNVSGHPTVDLPKDDVKKLDAVVSHLAKAKIIATRAYVVRAILRAAPDDKKLAPGVRKFLTDFPNKPRGLSKIRLARLAKANG